jgi:hypothetical protein
MRDGDPGTDPDATIIQNFTLSLALLVGVAAARP